LLRRQDRGPALKRDCPGSIIIAVPSQQDALNLEILREFVRKAAEILKRCPAPDTFLGRKTQEPFPWEVPQTRPSWQRVT